jgi:hypothetical protein
MRSWMTRSISGFTFGAMALMVVCLPLKAQADVIWSLSGLTFLDGGSVSGDFTTDDTGILLSWDLLTAAGSALPGETYDSSAGSTIVDAETIGFRVASDDAAQDLEVLFFGNLVPADSPLPVAEAFEFNANATIDRFNLYVGDAMVVPEPGSLALFGTGLIALWIGRRRGECRAVTIRYRTRPF